MVVTCPLKSLKRFIKMLPPQSDYALADPAILADGPDFDAVSKRDIEALHYNLNCRRDNPLLEWARKNLL
jgi:hypothetical protein